jgi:hypothetical protein
MIIVKIEFTRIDTLLSFEKEMGIYTIGFQ